MFEKIKVDGYDALKDAVSKKSVRTVILFTGSVDPSTGKSWCPDCETADPAIERCVKEISASDFAKEYDTRFIICTVGQRPYWKDPNNPFRTDKDWKVSCLPTLLDCAVKGKRLTEGQLTNENLLKAFFVEDVD